MFAAIILICAAISGALSKDEQVESTTTTVAPAVFGPQCFMSCIQKDDYFSGAIDFLEKINTYEYANYHLICGKQIKMEDCIRNCNQSVYPFDSRSEKTMCDSNRLEELKTHEQCLAANGAAMKKTCDAHCGGSMTESNKSRSQFDFVSAAMNQEQNSVCKLQKCHLQCFVDALWSKCNTTDPGASHFMTAWLGDILKAIRNELAMATQVDDSQTTLNDCQALLVDPDALFKDHDHFAVKSSEVIRASVMSLFVIGFAFAAQSYFH
jgi:hypothetical protein